MGKHTVQISSIKSKPGTGAMLRTVVPLLAGFALLGAGGSAQAQISENYALVTTGGPSTYNNLTAGNTLATEFTTGAGAYNLTDAIIETYGAAGAGFSLALYSNNAGAPGTLLDTYTAGETYTEGPFVAVVFGTLTPDALAADTSYWLVESVTDGGGTTDPIQTYSSGVNSPAGWTLGEAYLNGSAISPTDYQTMEIDANPAPEPSSLALAAAGLGTLGLIRRRKS